MKSKKKSKVGKSEIKMIAAWKKVDVAIQVAEKALKEAQVKGQSFLDSARRVI